MKGIPREFGPVLKHRREQRKLTTEELAQRVNSKLHKNKKQRYQANDVRAWEEGQCVPNKLTVEHLADLLITQNPLIPEDQKESIRGQFIRAADQSRQAIENDAFLPSERLGFALNLTLLRELKDQKPSLLAKELSGVMPEEGIVSAQFIARYENKSELPTSEVFTAIADTLYPRRSTEKETFVKKWCNQQASKRETLLQFESVKITADIKKFMSESGVYAGRLDPLIKKLGFFDQQNREHRDYLKFTQGNPAQKLRKTINDALGLAAPTSEVLQEENGVVTFMDQQKQQQCESLIKRFEELCNAYQTEIKQLKQGSEIVPETIFSR